MGRCALLSLQARTINFMEAELLSLVHEANWPGRFRQFWRESHDRALRENLQNYWKNSILMYFLFCWIFLTCCSDMGWF